MNAYSPDQKQSITAEILLRLSKGEPLAQICRDEFFCNAETWRNWCKADENLAIAYARAREDGFDAIAIECLDIADDVSNDTKKLPEGGEAPNTEWISRSKLRVETRLKLLAKWDPKRYGDRIQQEHTGKDGRDLPVSPLVIYRLPSNGRDTEGN